MYMLYIFFVLLLVFCGNRLCPLQDVSLPLFIFVTYFLFHYFLLQLHNTNPVINPTTSNTGHSRFICTYLIFSSGQICFEFLSIRALVRPSYSNAKFTKTVLLFNSVTEINYVNQVNISIFR